MPDQVLLNQLIWNRVFEKDCHIRIELLFTFLLAFIQSTTLRAPWVCRPPPANVADKSLCLLSSCATIAHAIVKQVDVKFSCDLLSVRLCGLEKS